TGEGMYVGCNDATCVVSDSIIENNWIHDTLSATQGDGIEIKKGSHSNVVRDNVIYDTNYPCILVYGTEAQPRNIIEGNVMWNCGDSGIQAAADAVIRNNIVLESPANGLNSQPHQGVTPANLEFVHNTVIGGSPCVRIGSWDGQPGLVFANNAIYCPSGSFAVGGLSGVTVSGNVFEPATGAFPSSGYVTGRSESADFIDVGSKDVYPTPDSPLIGAADVTYGVAVDFNDRARSGAGAGAYEWSQNTNPGWAIGPGFKDSSGGSGVQNPTISLTANPDNVPMDGSTTLNWTTSNADGCAASGDWAGNKPTAGTETVGPLIADSAFSLQCTNANGGSAIAQTSVTVDRSGGGGSGGGGGVFGWLLFAGLLACRRHNA
ncbi:MAG: right-handed parallel beta-helix repeat-containing protein, partial [Gammaproteobacteria bacterium]